jgi:shikimate kinase
MRKRSLSKTEWKKAFRKCEAALIAAVNRRDKVCKLCGSDVVLQADHSIISRNHKSTFFEIRQMTLLCRSCHTAKTFKRFGADVKVSALVAERETMSYIEWLLEESKRVKKWSVLELEEKAADLNGMYL